MRSFAEHTLVSRALSVLALAFVGLVLSLIVALWLSPSDDERRAIIRRAVDGWVLLRLMAAAVLLAGLVEFLWRE
jgi:hypothetical protein